MTARSAAPYFGSASANSTNAREVAVEVADVEPALARPRRTPRRGRRSRIRRGSRRSAGSRRPCPALRGRERVEDGRRQHVARGDRQRARRVRGLGFSTMSASSNTCRRSARLRDAVMPHLVARRPLRRRSPRRPPAPRSSSASAARRRSRRCRPMIESPRATTNGCVADERRARKHGVAEAERLPLAGVEVLHRRALELELARAAPPCRSRAASESARR